LLLQFIGISLVVGKEAIGHIRAQEGPEEGGMLLVLAAASVIVLSALCSLKLDLSVRFCRASPAYLDYGGSCDPVAST